MARPQPGRGACLPGRPEDLREQWVQSALQFVMAKALEEVGLVNYPTEWWHWSYGDRYWAMATGATAAIYGPLAI